MDYAEQLHQLKVLAGIYQPYQINDPSKDQTNSSHAGTEKGEYQRTHNIEPGTSEWFKLWFSRPTLTGEDPFGKKK
jgi:hypothetical protein